MKVWTHKSKHKNQVFFGNYEYIRATKTRILKFTNVLTGKELGKYSSWQAAQADGWVVR